MPKQAKASAVEMPGGGKRGKPNCGFPPFPPPLEIATRFPHSHSPDDRFPVSKKTNSERTRSYPPPTRPSGSSFNEKMLWFKKLGPPLERKITAASGG